MAMPEKNGSTIGYVARNFLLCLFIFTTVLFALSCYFVLRSTAHNRFLSSTFQSKSFPHDPTSKGLKKDDCRCNDKKTTTTGPLKVYMYDMDPEFHFGLLNWKPEKKTSVWPDVQKYIPPYPGGLNLQHSIEYWLTLDLLASEYPNAPARPIAAKRVYNSTEADVIFVPFFSSLSYNRFSKVNPHQKTSRNKDLQGKLVAFLTGREEWKRSGGRDHVVLAHHPNSMLDARNKLFPAMFILSDFGRYPPTVANVEKDVVAPYKHVIKTYENDTSGFDSRPILLYFQGAIYRKDVSSICLLRSCEYIYIVS